VIPGNLYIKSVGVYLPDERISIEHAVESGMCGEEFRTTGFVSVPVTDGTAPVDMAVLAARQAVHRLGAGQVDIDVVLHSSVTWAGPDGWAPSGYIMRELGYKPGAAYEVYQGCNGILSSMEIAAGLLALAPPQATALLTTAMNSSTSSVDRWSSLGSAIALGDAAAAVILSKDEGFARIDSICSTMVSELEVIHRGKGPLEQDTADRPRVDMAPRLNGSGTDGMQTVIDLQRLFASAYVDIMRRALGEAGIKSYEIDWVIIENIGADFTLMLCLLPLRLPLQRSTVDFANTVSHLGATDHIASLDNLLTTGQLSPGNRILLVGGSTGWNVASAVLTITDTELRL
jgi:3-oxoacyl-[acyl-carrier-protein] synthase III